MRREEKKLRARRLRKFLWVFAPTVLVCALLYFEQAAALYVLSTLAVCGLLLTVAFSDLETRDKEIHQQVENSHAPIINGKTAESSMRKNKAA